MKLTRENFNKLTGKNMTRTDRRALEKHMKKRQKQKRKIDDTSYDEYMETQKKPYIVPEAPTLLRAIRLPFKVAFVFSIVYLIFELIKIYF